MFQNLEKYPVKVHFYNQSYAGSIAKNIQL